MRPLRKTILLLISDTVMNMPKHSSLLSFFLMPILISFISFAWLSCNNSVNNENEQAWHILMLESEMKRNPEAWMLDFENKPKWNYTHGLVLMAARKIWEQTGEQRYFDYMKTYYDEMIDENGNILHNYSIDNYNIDHIKPGINLFDLYDITKDERYLTVLKTLREQLRIQPRTENGGYWHKKIYPNQLWLDGVYMNTPFYARYAKVFNEPEDFDDVLLQITEVENKTRDELTGLLYHAWDEKKVQQWANPETGHSPNFWGRSIGWYSMALVDVMDYLPEDHPGHSQILLILKRLMDAVLVYQDENSGLWYQVVDQNGREGNYLEASVSSMLAYTLTKAVNNNLLDASYLNPAKKAWQGILDHLITYDSEGNINLNYVCGVAGLGGNPYRDGSYEYYVNEIVRSNDPKGTGPFMLLSMEMEKAGVNLKKNK
jgi:unsaturated rhamnogalacturonyl hydrolase